MYIVYTCAFAGVGLLYCQLLWSLLAHAVWLQVEDWMTGVLNEMRSTNRLITKESVFHYCETKSRSAL